MKRPGNLSRRAGSLYHRILAMHSAEPQTQGQVAQRLMDRYPALDWEDSTLRGTVACALRDGYLSRPARGRYALTAQGEAHLDELFKERPRG